MFHFSILRSTGFITLTIWAVCGATAARGASGPDLIVRLLHGIESYGTAPDPVTGELTAAFAVATFPCNMGDEPAIWEGDDNRHPVIAQNMFRLMDGRFEQIGISWAVHEFFAVNQTGVCGECVSPFPPGQNDGYLLGAGCATASSSNINGLQNILGPRSQINAYTGYFPFPQYGYRVTPPDKLSRRLMVRDVDLDPALNSGASYFVEGHLVTPDDAAAGNGGNNASYRPIVRAAPSHPFTCRHLPDGDPTARCFTTQSFTRHASPAIQAWREADPTVAEVEIQVPEAPPPAPLATVFLAAQARNLGEGVWRYEFAVQNINSDRSIGSFRVRLRPGAVVANTGFHDVFYHSGMGVVDNYDGTDWPAAVSPDSVEWATTPHSVNPLANALRWGTLYNFRFDADQALGEVELALGLFKPVAGLPDTISLVAAIPATQCDDGITCITDLFDYGAQRCGHTADNASCDDGDPCTGEESCDAQLGCVTRTTADCDDDGVIDNSDARSLADCLLGPDVPVQDFCGCQDIDQTGHVDLLDWGVLQRTIGLDCS